MSLVALSLSAISANLDSLYSPDLIYHVQRILLESEESVVSFICLKLLNKLCRKDSQNKEILWQGRLVSFLDWLLAKEKKAVWDKSSPNKLICIFNFIDCLAFTWEDQIRRLLSKHVDYFVNGLGFESESSWHASTIVVCYVAESDLLPVVEKKKLISLFFYHLHFLLFLMETNKLELADSLRLDRILLILNRFSQDEELLQIIERRLRQQIPRGGQVIWWMDVVIEITRSDYCSLENRELVYRLCRRLLNRHMINN